MSDSPRQRLGQFGERLAVAHLEAAGYRIIERNFRCREGEIDVIAQRDAVLVFVEVRTRRGDAMGRAVDSLTPLKGARISAAADAYCQQRPVMPAERRIDVIAVDLSPAGRLLSLDHIENAFLGDELPALPGR
ncbi:MAG: YraN family protein [Dehalococcoidia bacterium]|jgi:putative endonuclease